MNKNNLFVIVYVVLLFIIAPFLYWKNISLETKKHETQNLINKIKKETIKINSDIEFAQKNLSLYEALNKKQILSQHERVDALSLLDVFRRKYKINKLSWKFSPQQDFTSKKLKNYKFSKTNVSLSFRAMSDELAFEFINDIENNFVGATTLKSLEIQRTNIPLAPAIEEIKTSNQIDLIKANLSFEWKKIKDMEGE